MVSIDINGDRVAADVLRAIDCVMNNYDSAPYLIIVKSRELWQSVGLQWNEQ